jgi:excisionase family DNA binding protein
MNESQKSFYTIIEFASKVGAHPTTIRKAIKNGRISALRLGGGERAAYRIPYSEIERMLIVDVNQYNKD